MDQADLLAPTRPPSRNFDITNFGLNFFAFSLILALDWASFSVNLFGILDFPIYIKCKFSSTHYCSFSILYRFVHLKLGQ